MMIGTWIRAHVLGAIRLDDLTEPEQVNIILRCSDLVANAYCTNNLGDAVHRAYLRGVIDTLEGRIH